MQKICFLHELQKCQGSVGFSLPKSCRYIELKHCSWQSNQKAVMGSTVSISKLQVIFMVLVEWITLNRQITDTFSAVRRETGAEIAPRQICGKKYRVNDSVLWFQASICIIPKNELMLNRWT